jgi:hypothetical protein
MIGKLIGNYRVLAKLSEGEASATYKAVDVRRDREVTIKVRTTRGVDAAAAANGKMQLSIWENSDREATIDSIDVAEGAADVSSINNRFSTASLTFADEPANDKNLNGLRQRKKKSSRAVKSGLRPLLAGAAILTVVVFHSFSQLTFLQNEISEREVASPKIKNEPAAAATEIPPTEFAAKRANKIELPRTTVAGEPALPKAATATAPPVRPAEREKAVPARAALPAAAAVVIRKKEPARESRAARLRRAERILTGI